jgi:hypothetical protein
MDDKTKPELLDSAPTVQEIVQRYLPDVEWTGATQGRCTCPGKHKHTSKSHRNDCWVFINGTPTVTCLHESCKDEVAGVNDKIRTAWGLYQPEIDPKLLAEAKAKAAARHALEEKARNSLPEILKQYKWNTFSIWTDKNGRSGEFGLVGACDKFLEILFSPEEILWCGDPADTGQERHQSNFKTQKEWRNDLRKCWTVGRYTCASTFKPGTYSRANVNVAETKYLIVEGDHVLGKTPETDAEKLSNKNACGAIFNWLRMGAGLRLRAVVDSGNKSLHGWFDMPTAEKLEELRVVLPAMGCDRAMFKPTQPARLAGLIRENGNEQRLLWIL